MKPRHLPIAACTMLLAVLTPAMIVGQKITPADVAATMSGSWKLNRELSPIKQEFSSAQRKLTRVWSIDGNDRLVLTSRIESLTFNSVEAKAVFDRQ